MKEKLESIKTRYDEVTKELMDPAVMSDFNKVKKLSKEQSDLKEIVNKYDELCSCEKNIEEANFKINPKVVDNKENVSCKFCPYKDICYHTSKDITYVNSVKDFLKKEATHGLDE